MTCEDHFLTAGLACDCHRALRVFCVVSGRSITVQSTVNPRFSGLVEHRELLMADRADLFVLTVAMLSEPPSLAEFATVQLSSEAVLFENSATLPTITDQWLCFLLFLWHFIP